MLARFVATGVYDPGDKFTVTNSPSMDIRKSSNVERLLWILNGGDGAEVARLMKDFAETGRNLDDVPAFIDRDVVTAFRVFMEEHSGGDPGQTLARRFGNTYWYYYFYRLGI